MSVARIRPDAQRGLALVCALMLLLAAMIIGVSVVRGAFSLMASARQEGERLMARAAAEAALRDAEHDIAGVGVEAGRAARFADAGGAGFVEGCGRGATDLGLCRVSAPPAWESLDLAASPEVLVPYGRYTGATFAAGSGDVPARPPGYLIERLEPAGAGPAHGSFYRITAIGFGMRASTQVVLQAIYRKPAPDAPPDGRAGNDGAPGEANDDSGDAAPGGPGGPGPPSGAPQATLPAGRIGWREIANWPELHARALP